MSADEGTTWVLAIPGELMRFRVESWTDPGKPHVVDLLAHHGRGECSCWNWRRVRYPRIRAGLQAGIFCRHVRVARETFLRELLERLAREHGGAGDE